MTTRPAVCVDCEHRYGPGVTLSPCKHQRAGLAVDGLRPSIPDTGAAIMQRLDAEVSRIVEKGTADLLALGAADYAPGAGGGLTSDESALSSLPSCPCWWLGDAGRCQRALTRERVCGEPARPIGGPSLRCAAGHVFAGTTAEHEQARGALAAATGGEGR